MEDVFRNGSLYPVEEGEGLELMVGGGLAWKTCFSGDGCSSCALRTRIHTQRERGRREEGRERVRSVIAIAARQIPRQPQKKRRKKEKKMAQE